MQNNFKVAGIIQARMGSSRFPGKTLAKIKGLSCLNFLFERIKKSELDNIIVVTSDQPIDRQIIDLCDDIGINHFTGSEQNVFSRISQALHKIDCDYFLRITGDDILLDSEVINYFIEQINNFLFYPKIVDFHFHGLEPERMGMGPLLASHGVLKRAGMSLEQMDLVEINEAFAAQVIAVERAFKDKKLAARFGLDEVIGEIPKEKLNVNGGAIALGHPVGSTGSRLVVTLAHELKKRKQKYGLASLCIGGGQGGAIIIENLSK